MKDSFSAIVLVWLTTQTVHGWCGASCRQGRANKVAPEMLTLSKEYCPASSYGLYKLHGTNASGGASHNPCTMLTPPLPTTWLCVHPPTTDAFISGGIVWKGRWMSSCNDEYRIRTLCHLIRAWRKASQDSAVPVWVFDVGANIGTFTLPLLAAGVNVVSFEADPTNLALLQGSIAAQRRMNAAGQLGNSITIGGALAELEGLQLCFERGQTNNAGSVTMHSGGARPCKRYVNTTTLDGALHVVHHFETSAAFRPVLRAGVPAVVSPSSKSISASPPHVIALKMDVQGYESHVIAGAGRLLARTPPIHIFIETANRSLLHELMHNHGYQPHGSFKDGCDFNVRLDHPKRLWGGALTASSDAREQSAARRLAQQQQQTGTTSQRAQRVKTRIGHTPKPSRKATPPPWHWQKFIPKVGKVRIPQEAVRSPLQFATKSTEDRALDHFARVLSQPVRLPEKYMEDDNRIRDHFDPIKRLQEDFSMQLTVKSSSDPSVHTPKRTDRSCGEGAVVSCATSNNTRMAPLSALNGSYP